MDIQKIINAKRRQYLESQPVTQPAPQPELEPQPLPKSKPVVRRPSQPLDLAGQPLPKLKPSLSQLEPDEEVEQVVKQLESELEMPPEPVGTLESLATIETEHSLFKSGWEYGQLLKEFSR